MVIMISMCFDEQICFDDAGETVIKHTNETSTKLEGISDADIMDKFNDFKDLAGSTNFGDLEKLGTVMYCIQVLQHYKEDATEDNVWKDFKGWKGDKYTKVAVSETFARVHKYINNKNNQI